ncbi:hypothetical protein H4Q32_023867 [Labeo rohita]|uniref:Endonuclease/exonuclease/phosphatase domain-containing protein n=1 Tax=Labeo rohita TaxID=84645 RepID=A0ABQ8L3C1_LABRO|nr:hypothetical protein H4Q32_023867 [Labeo rohita]
MCIQETWLNSSLDFKIDGYVVERKDREVGRGCTTFIKEGIAYKKIYRSNNVECVSIQVLSIHEGIRIIHFYNPCKEISNTILEKVMGNIQGKIIICGDFNAHNGLWGSKNTDNNGIIIEEFTEEHLLVCLNDGKPIRMDIVKGGMSCLDLTTISAALAGKCTWSVLKDNLGSDHWPVVCEIQSAVQKQNVSQCARWGFRQAKWEELYMLCEENFKNIKLEGNIEEKYNKVVGGIISAANQTIPLIRDNGKKKKSVPWWSEECSVAVRERNKAFWILKRFITQDTVVEYQKKRAAARRVIKIAKRKAWQEFCNTIGRETGMHVVWTIIRKMNGINNYKQIPVIEEEGKVAITNKEKTEVLAKTFAKVHSTENLSDKFLNRRQELSRIYEYIKKQGADNNMDEDFNVFKLKKAINNLKNTTLGRDMISYSMLKKFFYQR